MKSFNV